MSKVTCVVCGHTEHGDSSYCMNPTCGELLPTAIRVAPSEVDTSPSLTEPEPVTVSAQAEAPAESAQPTPEPLPVQHKSAVAAVSSARRWLLGIGAVVVLFGLAVAFSRGTARPAAPETSPEALPRASQVAAMAPQVTAVNDERVAVTLVLADRSEGKAAFYVVGGPIGGQPTTLAEAPRGAASVRVNAVNPEVEYCFVVVAVLSVDEVAPSAQVCTNRFGTKKP